MFVLEEFDDSQSKDDEYASSAPPEDEELDDMLRPYSYAQQDQLRPLLGICGDKDLLPKEFMK
jgi:hypothetical protein